jgi:hypothetical protein
MAAPCYILEGTWWSNRETPQVLPYFQALEASEGRISLSHRTIRSGEDIAYWVGRIPRHAGALVYIACHGSDQQLLPAGARYPVAREALLEALGQAKQGAIGFLHFSCCEMVDRAHRRASLEDLAHWSGARWVSGYDSDVDWLRSVLFDLALVVELYVPYFLDSRNGSPKLTWRARRFLRDYEQLARYLRFSGIYRNRSSRITLFPKRLRST